MLDQNTDRMWYVIGAVLIGAAIIFGMSTLMPNAFASVSDNFETVLSQVNISGGSPVELVNADFENYSEGWYDRHGEVHYDGQYAYLSEHADIYQGTDVEDGETIRINFRAKGEGRAIIRFGRGSSGLSTNYLDRETVDLTDDFKTHTVTITRSNSNNNNYIVFAMGSSSNMVLDSIEVWNTSRKVVD